MKNDRLTAKVLRRASNACGSICVVLLLLCAAGTCFSGSLIATWNPNAETDLAGYKVFYGTESGNYSVEKDVGNTTVYVADNLTEGQNYFFIVKAYDLAGNVSNPSVEVSGKPGKPMLIAIRQESAIRLVWTPVAGTQNYQIFKDGNPYFTPATPIATVAGTVFKYDDAQHVAAKEKESYYSVRAIAGGQPILTFNTVGAYDATLHTGLNLISLPLIPADSTIGAVLGGQLTGGEGSPTADHLRIWNGEDYDVIWYCEGPVVESNGKWIDSKTQIETDKKLDPSQSFWVKIQEGHADTVVTLTGQVPTDSNRVIALKKGYNFIGSCYPSVVSLKESELYQDKVVKGGAGSGCADIVRAWADSTYITAWVIDGVNPTLDGTWMDADAKNISTIQFRPGEGYVVWIKGDNPEKIWTYPNPAIKQ